MCRRAARAFQTTESAPATRSTRVTLAVAWNQTMCAPKEHSRQTRRRFSAGIINRAAIPNAASKPVKDTHAHQDPSRQTRRRWFATGGPVAIPNAATRRVKATRVAPVISKQTRTQSHVRMNAMEMVTAQIACAASDHRAWSWWSTRCISSSSPVAYGLQFRASWRCVVCKIVL